ncbi:MAG: translocase FtsK, partial [Bacillus sp. (in: firmicutes)]|nr:translocase FtsK [Bacillus sp. (in: firmicutes)]
MDWFKKIFRVFKDNSDVAEDLYEYKRDLPKNVTKKTDGSKAVNAKITYQYPRGAFRFPAIPDVEVPQRAPRQNRKVVNSHVLQENKKVEQPGPQQHGHKPQRHRQKEAVTLKKVQESIQPINNVKPKKEIRRHGPFRPTEIPSPIYGYERPRNLQVIEHELTGFLHEEVISQLIETSHEEETNRKIETTHEEMVNKLPELTHEEEATNKLRELAHEEEAANKLPELVHEEEAINKLPESAHEEEAANKLPELANEEEAANKLPELAHEEEAINKLPELIHEEEATNKLPDLSHEKEALHKLTDLSHADISNEDTEVLPKLELGTYEEIAVSQEQLHEELYVPGQLEMEASYDIKKADVVEQQNEQIEVEENNKTDNQTRRSTIPFNVLMLKQDRQKLVQQKHHFSEKQEKNVVEIEPVIQPTDLQKEEPFPPDKPIIHEKPVIQLETLALNHEIDLESYQFPQEDLLLPPVIQEANEEWLQEQEDLLNRTLSDFNVGAKVVNVTQGPSVT